jgi:hypothetical protein
MSGLMASHGPSSVSMVISRVASLMLENIASSFDLGAVQEQFPSFSRSSSVQ